MNASKIEILSNAFGTIPDAKSLFNDENIHNPKGWLVGLAARLAVDENFQWDDEENQWMNDTYQQLSKTKNWEKLRHKIGGNLALASMAAITIAKRMKYSLPRIQQKSNPFNLPELEAMLAIAQDNNLTDQVASLNSQIAEAKLAMSKYLDGIRTITDYVCEYAVNLALDEAEKASHILTHGKNDLPLPKVTNASSLAAVVNSLKLISEDRTIDILKTIGRIEAACGYRTVMSGDRQTTGLTFGNDVGNLLPDEWLKSDDQFDVEFAEERLSQYAKGKTSVKAGELIVLLDESKSMGGRVYDENGRDSEAPTREVVAKSILLMMARIAKAQNRGLWLITFDYEVRKSFDLKGLPLDRLTEVLHQDANGDSTNWEDCFDSATEIIQSKNKTAMGRYRKADVVIITDADTYGYCRDEKGRKKRATLTLMKDDWVEKFHKTKSKLGFKVHGILVGNADSEKELKRVADRVIKITDLAESSQLGDIISNVSTKK